MGSRVERSPPRAHLDFRGRSARLDLESKRASLRVRRVEQVWTYYAFSGNIA